MAEEAPIENVGDEVWRRVKKDKFFYLGFALLGLASVPVLSLLGFDTGFALFLIAPALIRGFMEQQRAQRLFMSQFAAANGYAFLDKGTPEMVAELDGALFKVGTLRLLKHIVSGTYAGRSLRLFNYQFSVSSGRHRRTVSNTVLELALDANFPNIFLINRQYWNQFRVRSSEENLVFSSHPRSVPLGGGFDDRFALYAPEDYEAESLQIFDQGTMEILQGCVTAVGPFAIEIVEDRLYVYFKGEIRQGRRLRALYDIGRTVVERVGPVAARMKSLLRAQEEVFSKLNQVS